MSIDVEKQRRSVELFMAHDYFECMHSSLPLLSTGISPPVVQALLISCQRLRREDLIEDIGPSVLEATSNQEWLCILLRVTLGQVEFEEAIEMAQDVAQRCQLLYYAGERLITLGKTDAGVQKFEAAAAVNADCLERVFADTRRRSPVRETLARLDDDKQGKLVAMNLFAKQFFERGELEKAIQMAEQARDLAYQEVGDSHPLYASGLSSLASIYQGQGDLQQAAELFERALRVIEQSVGPDSADWAAVAHNLAVAYHELGRIDLAEQLYEAAMATKKKHGGEADASYHLSMNSLAVLYDQTGRHVEAEQLFDKLIPLRAKVSGKQHPDYAHTLHDLAMLYCRTGRHKKAIPLFREALTIRQTTLGEDHPRCAETLDGLAAALEATGLAAAVEELGVDHPEF